MSDYINDGIEALREVETAWLSEQLSSAIANLGYPVGCGIPPHPDQIKVAATALFDRYSKMIEMAARQSTPQVTASTPSQRKMARHALGLGDGRKRSYRNQYVAALGTTHEDEWNDLCRRGLAERGLDRIATVGFCLTDTGALEALAPGEMLDPEDFPSTDDGGRGE